MTYLNIRGVDNGFVITRPDGSELIASSLSEAAILCGEATYASGYAQYAPGYSTKDLCLVKSLLQDKKKIEAIKLLRRMYSPNLGLREAKELCEIIWS